MRFNLTALISKNLESFVEQSRCPQSGARNGLSFSLGGC